jgi:hypothetical protein
MTLENNHGLFIDKEKNQVLGYLFNFSVHGVYSPDGKTAILPAEADTHNRILSDAEREGLLKCKIGQCGTFYYKAGKVQTWIGDLVSDRVTVNGQSITFRVGNMTFRGRLPKDANCFNFKRIS